MIMKTITLNIHYKLEKVSIIVKNGRRFTQALIEGSYACFSFDTGTCKLEYVPLYKAVKGRAIV